MSGHSDSTQCPICEEQMDTYSDYKPFDNVSGECIYCGFSYGIIVEQMDLERVNDARKEYNENNELKEEDKLKPLTQKDLDKYKDNIKNLW